VIELLPALRATGFYTEEVRSRGGRTGFRIVTLDGRTVPLASVGGAGEGGPRVGRYTVDLAALEGVCDALEARAGIDVIVVDEIGKMECLSTAFVRAARSALSGSVPVLGSVARAGGGFIEVAKRMPGVEVIALTQENRDRLREEVAARLGGVAR
jgi:nucleoside-triphosphatase